MYLLLLLHLLLLEQLILSLPHVASKLHVAMLYRHLLQLLHLLGGKPAERQLLQVVLILLHLHLLLLGRLQCKGKPMLTQAFCRAAALRQCS